MLRSSDIGSAAHSAAQYSTTKYHSPIIIQIESKIPGKILGFRHCILVYSCNWSVNRALGTLWVYWECRENKELYVSNTRLPWWTHYHSMPVSSATVKLILHNVLMSPWRCISLLHLVKLPIKIQSEWWSCPWNTTAQSLLQAFLSLKYEHDFLKFYNSNYSRMICKRTHKWYNSDCNRLWRIFPKEKGARQR